MKITRKEGKIETLKAAVKAMDGEEGKVGWFESARTEDGKPVAGIAAVQEFGSTKRSIPPRPFMRTTATEQQANWARVAEGAARAVLQGKLPPGAMTEALALKAEGDVRRKISKIMSPPLSQITLLARKARKQGKTVKGKQIGEFAKKVDQGPQKVTGVSTKPLVDTGLMLATLTSQVIKK